MMRVLKPFKWENIEVKEQIGEGNSAKVYKGLIMDKECALKFFKKNELARREVRNMQHLEHQNLIKMIDYDRCYLHKWIALVYCPNGDLTDFLRGDPNDFPESPKRYIMKKIANVIHYMHSKSFVHRDIKIDNVLLDVNYEPILCDVGLAINIEENSEVTRMQGTHLYMAQELYAQDETIQSSKLKATDIFSLGLMFYQILTQSDMYTLKCRARKWQHIIRSDWDSFWNLTDRDLLSISAKEMIQNMICWEPNQRWTIQQVLDCDFMSQEIPNRDEYQYFMFERLSKK